jgi:hypothetical protein
MQRAMRPQARGARQRTVEANDRDEKINMRENE